MIQHKEKQEADVCPAGAGGVTGTQGKTTRQTEVQVIDLNATKKVQRLTGW